MNDQEILKAIAEAKGSDKRNFKQSVDVVFNLQNIDFNRPDNKIDIKVVLPAGRGKPLKVGVFGDADFLSKATEADVKIKKDQLNKKPREIRKIAEDVDFFLAQTSIMVDIAKSWGKFLGTRGKMPQPLPPAADPSAMIKRFKSTVVLRSKGKTPSTLHCSFGVQDMDDAKLMENLQAILNALTEKLPNKEQNIKSAYVKTTMSKCFKII